MARTIYEVDQRHEAGQCPCVETQVRAKLANQGPHGQAAGKTPPQKLPVTVTSKKPFALASRATYALPIELSAQLIIN
jgi:hypothetical protein